MKKSFLLVCATTILCFFMVGCDSNELNVKPSIFFSTSESSQVVFSPGNLQYQASTDTWRFAENQYDYIGKENDQISNTNEDWIDLFGWGTGNHPTKVSKEFKDYPNFVDWGNNTIGDDAKKIWRTLTKDEWNYLLYERKGANMLSGMAQIDGINGLIIFPDKYWVAIDDVSHGIMINGIHFEPGLYDDNNNRLQSKHQDFTLDEWLEFEKNGAVFLPETNYRIGQDVHYEQNYGAYWTATEVGNNSANHLYFYLDNAYVGENLRIGGFAVRLVKDL